MSRFPWTDSAVRAALGLPGGAASGDVAYAGVSTDTRTIDAGDLYVALVGDRFDGHDFIDDAIAKGARGVVVSRPVGAGATVTYEVDDTLLALGRLAGHRRAHLEAPVVGITGSSGKTTTKEMTAAALASTLRVHATRGNLNNRVGMPLTLLAAPDDVDVVVLEMGTNEPGEIAAMATVSRPDIAVVTTVGESHLEKLGSLQGVLDEKLDMLRHRADGGRCVVGDEPVMLVDAARTVCPGVRVVGWSERASTQDRAAWSEVDAEGRHTFSWRGQQVTVPVAGRHAVVDALIALTVADMLGVPAPDAVHGLAGSAGGSMRGERRRIGSLTVIVDCYNANPQSVRASLDVLDGQDAARKVAVLGTMLELGDASARLHRDVLRDALDHDIDLLVATGGFAAAAAAEGLDVSPDAPGLLCAPSWQEAYPDLKARLRGDELVLLKASRGIAMEGILPLLEADFGAEAA